MEKRYYQPEIETMPREQLRAMQSEKLVKQVKHVWEHCAPYRRKMEALGVTPDDIKGLEDLHKLPFVTKSDLRDEYPYGMLSVPSSECVRMGNVVGIHEVHICTGTQTLTLKHEASTRAMLADGAVDAARFMMGKGAGLYNIKDMVRK